MNKNFGIVTKCSKTETPSECFWHKSQKIGLLLGREASETQFSKSVGKIPGQVIYNTIVLVVFTI